MMPPALPGEESLRRIRSPGITTRRVSPWPGTRPICIVTMSSSSRYAKRVTKPSRWSVTGRSNLLDDGDSTQPSEDVIGRGRAHATRIR